MSDEKKITVIRSKFSGIYRTTVDEGETWDCYAVAKGSGVSIRIPLEKYMQLKADSLEVKSHEPRAIPNIYGFSVTF